MLLRWCLANDVTWNRELGAASGSRADGRPGARGKSSSSEAEALGPMEGGVRAELRGRSPRASCCGYLWKKGGWSRGAAGRRPLGAPRTRPPRRPGAEGAARARDRAGPSHHAPPTPSRAWGGGGDTPARSASRGQRSLWPDPQLLGTSPNEASIPAPVSPLANVSSGKGERWVQAKG